MAWIHHRSITQNIFTDLKVLCAPHTHLPLFPWQPLIFVFSLRFCFSRCHILGSIQYVVFSDQILLLSNMHFGFFHVFWWLDSSPLFTANNILLSGCTMVYLSNYLLKDIHYCFHVWAIMDRLYKHLCASFAWMFSTPLGKYQAV